MALFRSGEAVGSGAQRPAPNPDVQSLPPTGGETRGSLGSYGSRMFQGRDSEAAINRESGQWLGSQGASAVLPFTSRKLRALQRHRPWLFQER
jgi:hypothetical protein